MIHSDWLQGMPRLVAYPMKLHWAGWETTTLDLQQAGWKLTMVQNPMTDRLTLAIQSDQFNMRGITPEIEFRHRVLDRNSLVPMHAPLRLQHFGHAIMVQSHDWNSWDFQPIDAQPQIATMDFKSLDDMCHFPKVPLLARTQAIVLPEKNVDQLLADILEKQAAAKMDYFKDLVATEGSMVPAHKFHCQIISLKEAA